MTNWYRSSRRGYASRNDDGGFTFVELLVVITIVGILFASAIASFSLITKRSRDAKRGSDLETIRQALEMCRSMSGVYPSSAIYQTGQVVCDNGVVALSKIPTDPKPRSDCESWYGYSVETDRLSYELAGCMELDDPGVFYTVTSP